MSTSKKAGPPGDEALADDPVLHRIVEHCMAEIRAIKEAEQEKPPAWLTERRRWAHAGRADEPPPDDKSDVVVPSPPIAARRPGP